MMLNEITAMIVDDNAEDISTLCSLLAALEPRIRVAGTETDSIRALQVLKARPIQLLFVDANMPKLNGITLIKSLPIRPRTIMTTAYREFAMDSAELGLGDCIPKPIEMDRLALALHRAVGDLLGYDAKPPGDVDRVFVKEKETGNLVLIYLDDLAAVEASHNDVIFHHNGTTTVMRSTLKDVLDTLLPPGRFLQVQRSFALNVRNFYKYDKQLNELYVHGFGEPISVSKAHFDAFMAAFDPLGQRNQRGHEGNGGMDDDDNN